MLQGVPGYAYCIDPGSADPVELPSTQWSPVPYPGSAVYSAGEMAALAYFADRYQGAGYGGYSVDDTVAAIGQIAYASAGGTTPPTSQAPALLVAAIETWIATYAGPWTVSLAMTPPPGSTFRPYTTYTGTITVKSASGAGVPGVQFSTPPVGGPPADQVSNWVWLGTATDAAGQLGFRWNIDGVPAGSGNFSAPTALIDGAPAAAPPTYAAPTGSNGQRMIVSGAGENLSIGVYGSVAAPPAQAGSIIVDKSVADAAYYGPGGAVFEILSPAGAVAATLTTGSTGWTPPSTPLPTDAAGVTYTVHEVTPPAGYGLAADQAAVVYPTRPTVVSFTGADEEPVESAQLGAEKVDAQTGAPLAGAVFDFRFDPADDGVYDQDLGTCTTGAGGICQPPVDNAPGGWLPGWYEVTEVGAPPGYWLDPATAVQHVYLSPGAATTASVTFGDEQLGSLQLTKTGNDTSYFPVAGATFTVTGPVPSTAVVGTLTVAPDGDTNTLVGLLPGSYTVTETTPPQGYAPVPPFTVDVAGGGTTARSVTDPVQPGGIVVTKSDAATGDPLAGATFDVRYDSHDDGVLDTDLGSCTTDASGSCSPPPNDGTGYLPGTYRVTETTAPPGYFLPDPLPTLTLSVAPGATTTFAFADPLLVGASFVKAAEGNVDRAELSLSGAQIVVTVGTSPGGPQVASCTTGATGRCATQPVLVSGWSYCWSEVAAPAGLAPGAHGCFTASNDQAARPVAVVDPGAFVAIAARKVDHASPSTGVAGAVFDLYRVGGTAAGPPGPVPPDAAAEPGQTWVARATTGPGGIATFPLQLPGYAYCTLEHAAPPGYVTDPAEHCTPVLTGSTAVPPPVTTVVTADSEAMVTVSAHKFNAASPGTGIPGAVYDLYVVGSGPPSGPPSPATDGAAPIPGDVWWARGTTGTDGELHFRVPAGYAWCLREVSAPPDYDLDTGLHCTSVINVTTPQPALTIALPEVLGLVTLYTHKYNVESPGTTIPGATYELVGTGALPPGWSAGDAPRGDPVPPGDWYVGTATTDAGGIASWTVPAGYRWCLHEVSAPPDYELDGGWHCTGVVSTTTPLRDATIALPEVPRPGPPALAFTGGPPPWAWGAGLGLAAAGGLLLLAGRLLAGGRRRGVAH